MKNEEGLAFHLHIKEGDIGRYVLLPGDPARCEKIARYFDQPIFVAQNREYVTWTGTLLGEKVSVVSTGIGCPSTAIAVEELIEAGADTLIRVGSSGAMQPTVHTGDVVIATAAIRDEGTTSHYLPMEFPAVAHIEVVNALMAGAANLGVKAFTGVCQSKDSFYGEVERSRMPMAQQLEARWNAWIAAGALASEMEAAALFILCAIYRKRGGAALQVINEFDLAEVDEDEAAKHMAEFDADLVIKVAVAGLKHLIKTDQR